MGLLIERGPKFVLACAVGYFLRKLRVTNSKNSSVVIVRAVDFGPHETTGFDISISPGAADALGVEIGDEVDIALADPKSPLGKE